jgi:hypothetical protein
LRALVALQQASTEELNAIATQLAAAIRHSAPWGGVDTLAHVGLFILNVLQRDEEGSELRVEFTSRRRERYPFSAAGPSVLASSIRNFTRPNY